MARKRRRRLRSGVVWFLVILNVACGMAFSTATSATHVHVFGARASDEDRIREELQWLKNKPCLSVYRPSVEEQIYRNPLVRYVDFSENIFGSAELKVDYYRPVAILKSSKDEVLTDAGFLCRMPDPPPGLPEMDLYPEATNPAFAMSMTWEPKIVAQICERASQMGIIKNLSISVTRNGSVCLNSGVTGRVVLGAPDELDEKFGRVRQILTAHPELMDQGKELVLIAPKMPVTRPMQGRPE